MNISYFNFTLVDRGGGSRPPNSLYPPLLAAIQTSVLQWLAFCRKGAKNGSEGGANLNRGVRPPIPPLMTHLFIDALAYFDKMAQCSIAFPEAQSLNKFKK